MEKLSVCILGASGYAGAELVRLISGHPRARISRVTASRHAGRPLAEVFPHLRGVADLVLGDPDPSGIPDDADVVFAALPHGASGEIIREIHGRDAKIIDLGADFRLPGDVYGEWYGDHPCPELLDGAVYGITELRREEIAGARLVANPGCYPTSSILPLAPLLRNGMLEKEGIIVDSKSGASGAGRNPSLDLHFCEVEEGVKAYKVGEHRHAPEMERALSDYLETEIEVVFTPHLVPMSRGMLSTVYARTSDGCETADLLAALEEFYRDCAFVRICPEGRFPNTSGVRGSNFCDIGVRANPRKNTAVLVCAIDNLVKGASGQAVQNMNVMADLPESMGLESLPLFP